jgi:hypothetical protein
VRCLEGSVVAVGPAVAVVSEVAARMMMTSLSYETEVFV